MTETPGFENHQAHQPKPFEGSPAMGFSDDPASAQVQPHASMYGDTTRPYTPAPYTPQPASTRPRSPFDSSLKYIAGLAFVPFLISFFINFFGMASDVMSSRNGEFPDPSAPTTVFGSFLGMAFWFAFGFTVTLVVIIIASIRNRQR